jgi:hypothetical protein
MQHIANADDRHWEKARKVNIKGENVTVDPDGPLAEATWAKQRLGRVTQALPNGYCGLPMQRTCPHANACLTCSVFVTTPEFLPQHREQQLPRHRHRPWPQRIASPHRPRRRSPLATRHRTQHLISHSVVR